MYQQAIRAGGAGAQYRDIDVTSKVESASPHRLVAILYEELLSSLSTMRGAIKAGDAARRNEAQARASAILQTLGVGLDFDQGGEVAAALASVYAETVRLLQRATRDRDPAPVTSALGMIGEIADAWNRIV